MSQRPLLELSHDPFLPPRRGFFEGADRKTHLDHLRHLSQWSRRVLVVSGPFGIGKSTLFKELSNNLDPQSKGARLSGAVATSQRDVLTGILQGFGMATAPNATADDLARAIEAHVSEQDEAQRICMVIVDDAQALEAGAVKRLMNMVSMAPLRIVLFGEASVISNVAPACKDEELEWFEIRLTGFPDADTRAYLEWRLAQAEFRGRLPFTDDQVREICTRSGGNPGVIDSLASGLLSQLEAGEVRPQDSGFPKSHAALAVLLVVLVFLVYLFVQPDTVSPERSLVEHSLPTASRPPATDALAADPTLEAATTAEVGDVPERVVDVPLVSEGDVTSVAGDIPERQPPSSEPLRTDLPSEPETTISIADQDQGASSAIEPVTETNSPEPAATPSPTDGEIAQTPAEAASDDSAIPVEEAAASGYRSAAWLQRQDPSRYTLQLLTLSTRARAEAFINRQSNSEEFAMYSVQRGDKRLYVITYGVYSTQYAAQQSAQQLTGELGKINAWVRSLRIVQDAIRNHPQ